MFLHRADEEFTGMAFNSCVLINVLLIPRPLLYAPKHLTLLHSSLTTTLCIEC